MNIAVNIRPHCSLDGKSPYEVFFGLKPRWSSDNNPSGAGDLEEEVVSEDEDELEFEERNEGAEEHFVCER